METRARYMLIGLFMLAVIAGELRLRLLARKQRWLRRAHLYGIRFDSSVSGLQAGSRCCSTAFASAR